MPLPCSARGAALPGRLKGGRNQGLCEVPLGVGHEWIINRKVKSCSHAFQLLNHPLQSNIRQFAFIVLGRVAAAMDIFGDLDRPLVLAQLLFLLVGVADRIQTERSRKTQK